MIELFLNSALNENLALYFFLGICPLITISADMKASWQMGVAVSSVMVVTASVNWAIYHFLLVPFQVQYLQLLFFVLTIAAVVQFLELFFDRFFPSIHESFGVFLPLITVNCAILGISVFAMLREYDFTSTIVFAGGGGAGWTLAICLMSGLRYKVKMSDIPENLGKTGLTMIIAAVMAMAFSGLSLLEFAGVN
jgi:Na+-transporting NADH:ubiquinone oxidoreductase subunit E